MREIIIGFISIVITAFMVSCATPIEIDARVPELASDEAMLDMLIDEPQTQGDLMQNSIVLEYLYANQKMQNYMLLEYIAKLASDKDSEELYKGKADTIRELYGLADTLITE